MSERVRKKHDRKVYWALFYTLLAVISVGWLADGVRELILIFATPDEPLPPFSWWVTQTLLLTLSLLLFGYSSMKVYENRQTFMRPYNVAHHDFTPHRCLIFFVSVCGDKTGFFRDGDPLPVDETKEQALDRLFADFGAFRRNASYKNWQWEQNVIGLMKNLVMVEDRPEATLRMRETPVEEVILIGSSGAKGSIKSALDLKKIMESYTSPFGIRYHVHEVGVDFESFEELSTTLGAIIDKKTSSGGGADERTYTDAEIAIDITSGTKMPSVIGAQFTVNRNITTQYVSAQPVATEDLASVSDLEFGKRFFARRKIHMWDLRAAPPQSD